MPDDPLQDVDAEVTRQAAIDESDADPATKVAARDAAREELEATQDVEPDEGPNPS
jgi:hypothetical protein